MGLLVQWLECHIVAVKKLVRFQHRPLTWQGYRSLNSIFFGGLAELVDCTALEMRQARKRLKGSNPLASAIKKYLI